MTAKPKVLPLTRLLNDLHKPLGVWPPYVTHGKWRIWQISDSVRGTDRWVFVGKRLRGKA